MPEQSADKASHVEKQNNVDMSVNNRSLQPLINLQWQRHRRTTGQSHPEDWHPWQNDSALVLDEQSRTKRRLLLWQLQALDMIQDAQLKIQGAEGRGVGVAAHAAN